MGDPIHVDTDSPHVAVPSHDGYSAQVTVYEHVDVLALQVGSDVHVGFTQVWNAAQLASTQVYDPWQVEEP